MTPPEFPPAVQRLRLESAALLRLPKWMIKLDGYTWYVSARSEADAYSVWSQIAWMPPGMKAKVKLGAYPTTVRQVP